MTKKIKLPAQLTVIFEDKTINVNGEGVQIKQDIENPDGISAIQWFGNWGEIEYFDKSIPNLRIEEDTHDGFIGMFANLFNAIKDQNEKDAIDAQEEVEASITYADKRAVEYPNIGEQFDVIWKQFKSMDKKLLNKETKKMLKLIDKVKKDNPKTK